jgi:hypothetical protein
MSKEANNQSDISNSNNGTSGTNVTYQGSLDNRANQLNPNNSNYQKK